MSTARIIVCENRLFLDRRSLVDDRKYLGTQNMCEQIQCIFNSRQRPSNLTHFWRFFNIKQLKKTNCNEILLKLYSQKQYYTLLTIY